MDRHLALLRKSFHYKALDFYYGPDDPHFKDLRTFQKEQLALLHDMVNFNAAPGLPSETYLHSFRVANDVFVFATFIGLSNQVASNLRWAALLHDIGKLDVPPEVLNKPGRLTAEEFEEMKKHTAHGAARIRSAKINHPLLKLTEQVTMYHHEQLDGMGYYGLKEKQIPAHLRLLHLCDDYDAVSAPRSYRPAHEEISVYETMKNILDPHGFLHKKNDMMFARPYCLLKLNLLEGDLSKEHHKMLEDYLLHPENYPEDAYAQPDEVIRYVD